MNNNNSLFFVRHGKLSLPYKDHSEMSFEILADLSTEKLNPPIDKDITSFLVKEASKILPLKEITKIYISPSKRCQDTAKLFLDLIKKNYQKEIELITVPELKEISFDLNVIYESLNKNNLNIMEINKNVLKALISGIGSESFCEAYQRVDFVFNKIRNKKEKVLVITHDFIMRVMEIYIENKGESLTTIDEELLIDTKRNLYVKGFAIDSNLSEIYTF